MTTSSTVKRVKPRVFFRTNLGRVLLGDSLDTLREQVADASVDLIVTSPPFGLVRQKEYGNVAAGEYVDWFRPFGAEFLRVLKPSGSLVIDIGGAWIPGHPTRSLYQYELVVMLCREIGFHLAQEFFWWNPAKLPTPAEWVTVRRVRVKDAINCVWWLSPTPWPRASNRRVLTPYSDAMQGLIRNGYKPKLRPSGHDISDKFGRDNGAAIPPNLIAIAHTESNSAYLRACKKAGVRPHPARFPAALPEFFIRMLSDSGDLVVDPFAGSCVTGEVCERLRRRWICGELVEGYLRGARSRFESDDNVLPFDDLGPRASAKGATAYRLHHPAASWTASRSETPLAADGGRRRALPDRVGEGRAAKARNVARKR